MYRETYTMKFGSIQELAHAAKTGTNAGYGAASRHDISYNNNETYGGLTFDDAVKMGANGGRWDEGAKDLQKAHLPLPEVGDSKMRARFAPAYAGSRPSIPRHLAGAPRSMIRTTPVPNTRKVIRLGVHVGRLSGYEQHHAVNRGAAILSAVEALESEGHAVEITALWRNKDDEVLVSIETLIKPANAFFSAADCAFALAHIAFQRRLCWAVMENTPGAAVLSDGGYGNGIGVDLSDFDIHIPYGDNKMRRQFETPQTAFKWVMKQFESQLETNNKAAA